MRRFLPLVLTVSLLAACAGPERMDPMVVPPPGEGTTVRYSGTDSTGGLPPVDTRRYSSGNPVTVLGGGDLVRAGFVWAGWNTQADRLGTSFAAGAVFPAQGGEIELHPVWIPAGLDFRSSGTRIILRGTVFGSPPLVGPFSVPAGVTAIDEAALASTGITSVSLPASVTSIGEFAFFGTPLTEVFIPASITSIGDGAFAECSELAGFGVDDANPRFSVVDGVLYTKDLTGLLAVPSGITGQYAVRAGVSRIAGWTFLGFSQLTEVILPPGLTVIGDGAFFECSGLAGVNLPAGLRSIGDDAFAFCSSLGSIDLPEGLVNLGSNAFGRTALTSLALPASVATIGRNPFGVVALECPQLEAITVAEANQSFRSIGGVLYDKAASVLLQAPAGLADAVYTVPDGVFSLFHQAFLGNRKLTGILLPDSLVVLGTSAFANCSSLAEITLPAGLGAMNDAVFAGCAALAKVTVLAPFPPNLAADSNIFGLVPPPGLEVRVPAAALEAYQAAQGWSTYASLIFPS